MPGFIWLVNGHVQAAFLNVFVHLSQIWGTLVGIC